MLNHLLRLLKRLAVFAPVILVGSLLAFSVFPLLDDQLPIVIALLLTYVFGAYVVVPALLRVYRAFVPAKHSPRYCVTPDGFASDPLNIALIGTRDQVIDAMARTGWRLADKLTWRTALRTIMSTVYGSKYETAPMSPLYLFGRKQDLSFQDEVENGGPGSRHHVRFWAATYDTHTDAVVSGIHWHNRRAHVNNDSLLWVGAASRDIGVTFIRHNAQITHLVDPNTNAEREIIVNRLIQNKFGKLEQEFSLGDPYKLLNIHSLKGHIHSDGLMKVIRLSNS